MIFLEAILNFDLAIFEFFEKFIRMGWLTPIMKIITTLGDDGIFFIIIGLVMLFFKKTRKVGVVCLGSLLVMTLLNNEMLKPLMERPRPYNLARLPEATQDVITYYIEKAKEALPKGAELAEAKIAEITAENTPKFDWVGFFGKIDWHVSDAFAQKWSEGYVWPGFVDYMKPTSLSFPSGHTSSAFTFAMALTLVLKNKWASIGSFVFAFLMGVSRIYVGVHYPTDVIAGAFVGILYALIGYFIFSKLYDVVYPKIEAAIINAKAKNSKKA